MRTSRFPVSDGTDSGLQSRSWLLAIDTSSDIAGLALFDGAELYLRQWPCVRAQTTQVLPAIQDMLTQAGVALADLSGIAVATGPGTFTGLRVGMSLAKGVALGNALPIIGIPTLQATARPWIQIGAPVIAVVPAGRGRLVWQRFDADGDHSTSVSEPRNTTPEELIASVGERSVAGVVGELSSALREQLHDLPVPIIAGPEAPVRAGSIVALGRERLLQGDYDDLATLEPHYVHGIRAATRSIADPQP